MTHSIAIKLMPYDTWRMRSKLTLLILLTFAALVVLPASASAFDLEQTLREQHVQYERGAENRVAQGGCMSLSQAIESVRRRTNGKILSAETRVQGGREVHHIRVLTKDGKVKSYTVNGCSG